MIYLQLFWEYFKIGLFAVGGGQATIPFLVALSEKTGWYTIAQLTDMVAISESTPGPIGVNMATYVGYRLCGIGGSVIAAIGLVTPSVICILIVIVVLQRFKDSQTIKSIFYGIRPASTGLIVAALYTIIKICMFNVNKYAVSGVISDLFNIKYLIFFAILVVAMNIKKLKKVHPLVYVAIAALVGVIFKF